MDDDDLGTEAELAHVRRRVREIQRRAMLAKGAAVPLTLLGLVLGLFAEPFVHNALFYGLAAGGLCGRLAWMRLEPQEEIDDL